MPNDSGTSSHHTFCEPLCGDAGPFHAVDRIGSADRFDYDANMTVCNKGLAGQEMIGRDDENRLSEVQDSNCFSHFVVLSSRPTTRRDYPPVHQRGWVWRICANGQCCRE